MRDFFPVRNEMLNIVRLVASSERASGSGEKRAMPVRARDELLSRGFSREIMEVPCLDNELLALELGLC